MAPDSGARLMPFTTITTKLGSLLRDYVRAPVGLVAQALWRYLTEDA